MRKIENSRMRKSIIAVLITLVLSTTVIAASVHYGKFYAKDNSGRATGTAIKSSSSYESCYATFIMSDGRRLTFRDSIEKNTVSVSGIDGIECEGKGYVVNPDKTKLHGKATLIVAPGPITSIATITVRDDTNNVIATANLPTTTFKVV